jgi:serine protease SohB
LLIDIACLFLYTLQENVLEFLYEYGLFLAKAVTVVITLVAIVAIIAASAMKQKAKAGEIEITDLSEKFEDVEHEITYALLSDEQIKQKEKADKKAEKEKAKADLLSGDISTDCPASFLWLHKNVECLISN